MNAVEKLRKRLDTHNDNRTLKHRTPGEREAHAIATVAVGDLEDVWRALTDMVDGDFTYIGRDADVTKLDSLYNRVKRARAVVLYLRTRL